MITLKELSAQLSEALSYGSDKLYVIEIKKNGYWETYHEPGYSKDTCQAWVSSSKIKGLVKDLNDGTINGSQFRIVTYAPVGAN